MIAVYVDDKKPGIPRKGFTIIQHIPYKTMDAVPLHIAKGMFEDWIVCAVSIAIDELNARGFIFEWDRDIRAQTWALRADFEVFE